MRGSEFFRESGVLFITPGGSRVGDGFRAICAAADETSIKRRKNAVSFLTVDIGRELRCMTSPDKFLIEQKSVAQILESLRAFDGYLEVANDAVIQAVDPAMDLEL